MFAFHWQVLHPLNAEEAADRLQPILSTTEIYSQVPSSNGAKLQE